MFSSFSDSASTAAATPGLCAISYTASVSNNAGGISLSTFFYSTQSFNIYSGAMN